LLLLYKSNEIRYFSLVVTIGKKTIDASSYVRGLMARGQYTFTLEDATKTLKIGRVATRAALRRLRDKKVVVSPARAFYVIVPPEYERLGCLPAEQFISELMSFFREPYYVGLLSAAELHGAAHQKPQEFQVVTTRNRKMILGGRVTIRFIAKKWIDNVPTMPIKTPRGFIQVSTPEATALDLLLYPEHVGGLSNAATVLSELSEKMDPKKLKEAASIVPNISSIQRAGFLFDRVLRKARLAEPLEAAVRKRGKAIIPLLASGTRKGVMIDPKWKLFVNEKVEPDV
jgi:predicted transcriptional regulator of viral defense system